MSPAQRLKAMRANRGLTKLERLFASSLWRCGFRYLTYAGYMTLTGERLSGQPDIIFSRKKVAIFVDGCFWHGCEQCGGVSPRLDNFWANKIATTITRDRRVTSQLRNDGWIVIRIPEHDLRQATSLRSAVDQVANILRDK